MSRSNRRAVVRIFSCHHEKPIIHSLFGIFVPIWTGGEISASGEWISDLEGLNLFNTPDLGDMRHQFFVWKNCLDGLDYVGFEQYRRIFIVDPLSSLELKNRAPLVLKAREELASNSALWRLETDAETFAQHVQLRGTFSDIELSKIEDWISNYDIIIPRRFVLSPTDLHFMGCHDPLIWPKFLSTLNSSSYFANRMNHINPNQVGALFCNMFIIKTELFKEYMAFWSEIIFSMQGSVDRSIKNLAFISERLFSFWVMQKQVENPLLRVCQLPYCIPKDYLEARPLLENIAEQRLQQIKMQ